jgi:hypothetical protein
MGSLERWGFVSLISCLLLITLSVTVLTGSWAIAIGSIAVLLGILSGGLYAVSVRRQR